ncbi:hypothetical protein [Klebsiella pneumoniae]|uniref:hypothetical protein n=1 Tax=Klebsiella pneumoniae TaxID=573 RepID=UPI002A1876D8|nr:hypothetical protein [Klebsiella pneumoniae]
MAGNAVTVPGLATDERKIVAVNCGVGGQIIEHLSKGHSRGFYNRIISAVTQIKAIADTEGKTCGVVGFYILAMNITMTAQKEGRQTAQNTEHS